MKRVSRTYTVNKIYSVDLFPVFFLTRLRFFFFFLYSIFHGFIYSSLVKNNSLLKC